MTEPTLPDITVEDLLKIIGDKEVQLVRQSAQIKILSERILQAAAPTAKGGANATPAIKAIKNAATG
jgi:hypothetical protein